MTRFKQCVCDEYLFFVIVSDDLQIYFERHQNQIKSRTLNMRLIEPLMRPGLQSPYCLLR